MKNLFFAIAASAFLFSSCVNNSEKKTNIHKHDDGSQHVNHDATPDISPEQEVFELKGDSLTVEKDTIKSKAKKEHSHAHEGGHEHAH
jgi:hypothetical protein